ncbi:MAG: phosphoribosylglycinamide formyltransferase [Chthoniobacterales bacterium]|nr:phosphoribosylglycinamide formyltransferase [Chthoniobacterales bacterium]
MLRLGVLGSGRGSNLGAILRAIGERSIPARVSVVISDVPDSGILEIARSHGVDTECIVPPSPRGKLDGETERKIVDALRARDVDLVALAGFMRIVGSVLLSAYPRRIINIHPSLLPAHRGSRAWEKALAAGDKTTGCTVHYVDDGVDTGEIIEQCEVPVLAGDTADTLHARIQKAEHELYPAVIGSLARRVQTVAPSGS